MTNHLHPSLRIENLSIGYAFKKKEHKVVAQDICATLYYGEFTCLLGPNGVGKSTLLRTLSAFQPKLAGNIYLEGKEISDYQEKELSKLIGVVLTEKVAVHNMTVMELVSTGRSPYTNFWGKLSTKDLDIVHESIHLVGISNLANRLVETLSDGERQKAMIAKALAQQTPIILLDEPTAFLDFPSKVEIMQLLHRLSRKINKTILLSTHDLELALQIADKVWLVNKQKPIEIGIPEDLILQGKLTAFFPSEGIIFDYKTGMFKIRQDCVATIKLTGNEQKNMMIHKALLRNSICSSPHADSNIHIHTHEKTGQITLFLEQEKYTFENIEQLLIYLKNIKLL